MTNPFPTTEESTEADRLEQETPLLADSDEPVTPPEPPLEADEGDVLEQAMQVPDDEDYPPDS
jgi:hypothetical protein